MQDENQSGALIFSERTDALATSLGISLRDLAGRVGFSQAMLFGYRTGKYVVSRKAWAKLEALEREVLPPRGRPAAPPRPPRGDPAEDPRMLIEEPAQYRPEGTSQAALLQQLVQAIGDLHETCAGMRREIEELRRVVVARPAPAPAPDSSVPARRASGS